MQSNSGDETKPNNGNNTNEVKTGNPDEESEAKSNLMLFESLDEQLGELATQVEMNLRSGETSGPEMVEFEKKIRTLNAAIDKLQNTAQKIMLVDIHDNLVRHYNALVLQYNASEAAQGNQPQEQLPILGQPPVFPTPPPSQRDA